MRTARVISESDIVPNRAAGLPAARRARSKNQEWVSPSLNTTADGALYLTVLDLARWAIGLNHARVPDSTGLAMSWTPVKLNDGGTYPYGFGWSVEEQRGHPRIGHGGSWQGFRTSIERYPEYDLTVIAMANLDAAEPGRSRPASPGSWSRTCSRPHRLPVSTEGPPEPIAALLAEVAAGKGSPKLAPGLRTFASKSVREGWAESLEDLSRWESAGCDDVSGKGISRLGERIARICYARGTGKDSRLLASVMYTADWRAAAMDSYPY